MNKSRRYIDQNSTAQSLFRILQAKMLKKMFQLLKFEHNRHSQRKRMQMKHQMFEHM